MCTSKLLHLHDTGYYCHVLCHYQLVALATAIATSLLIKMYNKYPLQDFRTLLTFYLLKLSVAVAMFLLRMRW